MKRLISTMAVTGGLALAGIAAAPAAFADVSNPADNPYAITVTGDDGLTYSDGLDTLPGYDDYACTYIPGAWFDFANNRVRYADGQSIPWTEWDRASGYDAWKAKQTAAAPAPAPAAAPAAGTTSGSGTSKPSGSSGTAQSAVLAAGASADPSASPSPSASTSPEVSDDESAEASAPTSAEAEVVSASAASSDSASSTSTAGLAILGALFGIGGLAFGGYTFFRRGPGRTPA